MDKIKENYWIRWQSISYCKKRPRINVVYDVEESKIEDEVPSTSINAQCINEDTGNGNMYTEFLQFLNFEEGIKACMFREN